MGPGHDIDTELDLIASSLLPDEYLRASEGWPRDISIRSNASTLSLHVSLMDSYTTGSSVEIEVRGSNFTREDDENWKIYALEKLREWDPDVEFPLYQLLATHFLPLLAPSSPSPPPSSPNIERSSSTVTNGTGGLHHALLTSHHLLSTSKRKDLVSLASQLSLLSFSKTGHPGIMYAMGDVEDLEEWIREVKSWQWLALRVRITPEPVKSTYGPDEEARRGQDEGARGGRGRGHWDELEKVGEALEWLRPRGSEKLLTDCGIGA